MRPRRYRYDSTDCESSDNESEIVEFVEIDSDGSDENDDDNVVHNRGNAADVHLDVVDNPDLGLVVNVVAAVDADNQTVKLNYFQSLYSFSRDHYIVSILIAFFSIWFQFLW